MNGLYGTSCGYTDKCLEKGSSDYFSVYFKIVLTIFHFSIGPWTRRIARAIQKERKVYLWDAPRIKETSARFENMVALELYRAVTAWNDMGHGTFSLHFIKNKEQQEVDFLIANDNEPFVLIEAKLSDPEPSQALKKFQGVLKKPAIQLVEENENYRMIPNGDQYILVAPAYQWLSNLP